MSLPLKLYLAGPEVFLPDARAVLDAKAALTRAYGFEPICPGDLTIPPAPTKHQFGLNISEIDEGFMNRADGVIANLTPFRGIAADPGTVFELGYMCGAGKICLRPRRRSREALHRPHRLRAMLEGAGAEGDDAGTLITVCRLIFYADRD